MMNARFNILLAALVLVLGGSCVKNQDNTNGYHAHIALLNLSPNSGGVMLQVDNEVVTPNPISFGAVSGGSNNIYLNVIAGLRQLRLLNANSTLFDKNYSLTADKYYSSIVYDSVAGGLAHAIILRDDTTAIDSLGRTRFLHLYPGTDTVTVTLNKADTSFTLGSAVYYLGSLGDGFNVPVKPGSYRLNIRTSAKLLYSDSPFVVQARQVFSVVLRAQPDVSGKLQAAVTVLQHH